MVILDFHILPESSTGYLLEVFARSQSQLLASTRFEFPLSFMTEFELGQLDLNAKDPAGRVDRLRVFGGKLYQKLFNDDVKRVWQEQKDRADFLTLCLRIAPEARGLEALPWETLFDGGEFIAAGAKTGVSRLPLDVHPQDNLPAIPLPLRMLSLVSSPLDLPDQSRLQIEREQEILLEAVNTPAGQGKLIVDFEDEAKLDILENSLEAGYHILHFTGHGISPRDGGGLLLEDAEGKSRATAVAEVIRSLQKGAGTLRLAMISGCQTARTLHTGAFTDLARALVEQRKIPAVIAMQFSITDTGGLKLAEKLYPRLIEGQPLEIALSRTRRDLLLSDDPFLQGDALASVLIATNGQCLKSREAEVAAAPNQPEIDPSFHLSLPQLGFAFYGRRREYRQIRDGLVQRNHRAVIIHGIGGIGKTALVSHAAARLRHRFRGVYAFDCSGGALAPERIIAELHQYLDLQGVNVLQQLVYQPLPPETLANFLAQALSQWPLLLIFDNFETQLAREGEDFRIADESLRAFIGTLVKATAAGSRFIFTNRYLFDVDDKGLSDIQSLPLHDLSRTEALMLMQRLPKLAETSYWEKIEVFRIFGGHPYALVALDRYCQHQPMNYALQGAKSVQTKLREFIAIELNYTSLSERSRELHNCISAFRKPVPRETVEWVMKEKSNLDEPTKDLIGWGMLTPIQNTGQLELLVVHSLVRDFCHDQQAGEIWRNRLRVAAVFYLPPTGLMQQDDKSPTAVWDEIEAFELLMEAGDVKEASALLQDVHPLLDRWGYGRFLESQNYRLLGRLEQRGEAVTRHNLGILLQDRGEYDAALEHHQLSFKILEELGNHADVAISLHQIGMIHEDRGEYDAALELYQRSLKIKEELGDREGIAASFHQIGIIHQARGEYDAAFEQYQRSLKIWEGLDDRVGVARSLQQIGTIHQARGNYDAALEQYQRSLEIKEELGNRAGIALSLHEIGNLYYLRGEYDAALEQYQRSLEIKEELGNRTGVVLSLHQIGMIHQARGEYDSALEQYQLSLKIAEELGNRAGAALSLHQIGMIYESHGKYDAALERYQQSLKIEEELGNRAGIAASLHQIGIIHQQCGDYGTALEKYRLSLKLKEELGNHADVASSLFQIGTIHQERGEYDVALVQYQHSLRITTEFGNRAGVALSQGQIGKLFMETGRYFEAISHLLSALSLFIQLQSPEARITANNLRTLRSRWGEQDFDVAWQQATDREVSDWLK